MRREVLLLIPVFIILMGIMGYFIYADIQKKWPFHPYVRKSYPAGSSKLSSKKTTLTKSDKEYLEAVIKSGK